MHDNSMVSTNVYCRLESCKYHRVNNCCALSSIEIAPCQDCGSGESADETMCASYEHHR